MFTGIVEYQGSVVRLMRRGGGARLEVHAPEIVGELQIGDSVAVNGACVTVTERNEEAFACDLVPETVARTNLGILEVGEDVNLERPVRATDRLGGHIVQGHVDAVGLVRSRRRVGAQEVLEVTVPFELTRYLAPQGSVSMDGVSLTVVAVDRDRFRVALIPHTVSVTTLGRKGQGASVNVEVDVISKYVERHMAARTPRPTFTIFEEQPKERAESPRPAAPKPPPTRPVAHTPPVTPSRSRPAPKSTAKKTPAKRPVPAAKRTAKRPASKPAKRRR
ncbi:MAG: riboflavin synthase [Actinobacteria bacterium]|nr:MAG: riboflavin synthase [Actinomycetota bacterium]